MHLLHKIGMPLHRVAMRPFLRRPRLIVIFSVMRSGTSLMTRILSDNPQISGFGEAHVTYNGPDDLLDLKYWIARFSLQYPRQDKFLLDKVLHASHVPNLRLLMQITELHAIFMIREPLGNVRSLQKLFAKETGSFALPWDYLKRRYTQLEEHLEALRGGNPIAVISYEALTDSPETVLLRLSDHLGLSHPLQAQYSVPSYLGRWGLGDGSRTIRSGSIVSRKKINSDEFSEEVPRDVNAAYHRLCRNLKETAGFSFL